MHAVVVNTDANIVFLKTVHDLVTRKSGLFLVQFDNVEMVRVTPGHHDWNRPNGRDVGQEAVVAFPQSAATIPPRLELRHLRKSKRRYEVEHVIFVTALEQRVMR